MPLNVLSEKNDLETAAAAYQLTTGSTLMHPTEWQGSLYSRLSAPDGDIGSLLMTPCGVGKTEAVVIPALGLHRGGAPRRLFLIQPDGSVLDEALYRLAPYLKTSVMADETARSLYLDTPTAEADGDSCRRFYPDGTEDPAVVTNPLEADVDLVLTTFTRFRDLFFGSGGIHALPSAFATTEEAVRRDLFFFDEAHGYGTETFARFHRLVEFLFAEDSDVVIGSSTMPDAFQEELSFLEPILVTSNPAQSPKTLRYQSTVSPLEDMESAIRRAYYQNARVFGVLETSEQAEALYTRLASSYPHSVYLYHATQPDSERRRLYAQLRELEKEGEGYLLLTTGDALETSDLDATVLLTTLCPPENLIRRAGRCNRRSDLHDAEVIVFGDSFADTARSLNAAQATDYKAALHEFSGHLFDADVWKGFI